MWYLKWFQIEYIEHTAILIHLYKNIVIYQIIIQQLYFVLLFLRFIFMNLRGWFQILVFSSLRSPLYKEICILYYIMPSNKTLKKRRINGGVRIIPDFNKDSAITFFIKNASYTVFSRSGISGITVLATLNKGVKSPYKMIRTNNINAPVLHLLFKFFICGKNQVLMKTLI